MLWNTTFSARFHDINKNESIVDYIKQLLEANEFIVKRENEKIFISAPDLLFYKEAENHQLTKLCNPSKTLEEFICADKENFEGWNKQEFFSPSEQSFLLHERLDKIHPDSLFIEQLQRLFSTKVSYFCKSNHFTKMVI